MKYTKLCSANDGPSYFEDAEMEFASTVYAPPAPPLGLSAFTDAEHFCLMQAPAGWESDWHPSSARNFFVVLTGEWEVTASNGETRRFGAGSILLVEDTSGKGHKSRVVSEIDSVAVMMQLKE